jgi:signal recognition particle GTPase
MGLIISKVMNALSFTKDTRILLLGLDAAGKTTAVSVLPTCALRCRTCHSTGVRTALAL